MKQILEMTEIDLKELAEKVIAEAKGETNVKTTLKIRIYTIPCYRSEDVKIEFEYEKSSY